jgi:hypothetical protein
MYYTYCLSFYFYGVTTVIMDEKKKDFFAMFAHHVATILLVVISGLGNMHRIGAVIMLTFDICDVFLELAKLSHKLKCHNVRNSSFCI